LGVRAGFLLQSFCSGDEQKGFSLQSLTQNLSKYQNIALLITLAHFSIELRLEQTNQQNKWQK